VVTFGPGSVVRDVQPEDLSRHLLEPHDAESMGATPLHSRVNGMTPKRLVVLLGSALVGASLGAALIGAMLG